MDQVQKCIHKGMLLKRCRLSWRPRYVEMVLDPGFVTVGNLYAHQLILYDQHRHMVKNKISFEDVVTVRSCRDCIFQVFMSDGKILQFRSESVESQAHWMAALKVGLGKGHIFHARVHTSGGLEHALLYSIGVNLPAHRVGQLDRVLVLASPINDININAWDLNRVKGFVESDVGIRMDICSSCIRGGQSDRITFIMEKKFINDCILFLLREAKIQNRPQLENGLRIYKVPHQCGHIKQPDTPAPLPPPYPEDDPQSTAHLEVSYENYFNSPSIGPIVPAYPIKFWDESPHSPTGKNFPGTSIKTDEKMKDFRLFLPPRTIPRLNYESSVPARAHPYIKYQPDMYHQSRTHFEAPYQISSRIIITDSGKVQFERNIMGNAPPQEQRGGLLFKRDLPVPPKGLRDPGQIPRNRVARRRNLSRDKEEVQPTLQGARFLESARKKGKAPAPPPKEISPVQTNNPTMLLDKSAPTQSPPIDNKDEAVATQSSQVLGNSTTKLVQSTSDMGLVTRTTNYSITTLFPRTDPTPPRPPYPKQSIKRTSSDPELSSLNSRAETQSSKISMHGGNPRIACLKAASMKRASEVSDTSDVYIIPTPPSSTTSFRDSISDNPISPSYIRESEFLQGCPIISSLLTDDDCVFVPDEKKHEYVNQHHYINGTFINEKLSRQSNIDGFQISQKKTLSLSVSLPTVSTIARDRNLCPRNCSTVEDNTPRGDHIALPNFQQKKPIPRPRKNTLPSQSSPDIIMEQKDSKFEWKESENFVSIDEPHAILSPKQVTFNIKKEQTIGVSETLFVSPSPQFKTRSLPRKPPVPKPRKLLATKTTNLSELSHLSISDGDLGGSLELDNNNYLSKSTRTILYNGIQVGVTDL